MRMALRFLGSISLAVALMGFLACAEGEKAPGTDPGPTQDVLDPGPGGGDLPPQEDTTPTQDVHAEPGPGNDACTPQCAGKECGPDGCGGFCGTCDNPDKPICNEQGLCEPCVPDCEGKECGDDGCGGSCGTCEDPEKPVCSKEGLCIEKCTLPDTWGGVGVITKLESPAEAAEVANVCPDYSGDGKGDSGLRQVATMINPELQKAIAEGDVGILFEFEAVTDFVNTESFDLNGLVGEPTAAGSTEFEIEREAYDPETCEPLIAFEAEIKGGALKAGPSIFILDLAALGVEEVPLVLKIADAQLSGDVITGGPDGVTVKNGILAGVITKQLVEEALAIAEEQCDVPEPPSFCSYLGVAKQFLPMLFDLDQDGDGKKDAMSVCFKYELGPATIVGYSD